MIAELYRDTLLGSLILILMTVSMPFSALGQETRTPQDEPRSKPPVEVVHRQKTDTREERAEQERAPDDSDTENRNRRDDDRSDAKRPTQNP